MFSLPVTFLNALISSLGDLLLRPRADPVHRGDQQLHQRVGDLPLPLVQQRGQQRHPQRQRVRAQMGRRLHRGPRPPAGHDLRRDVGEQTRWQPIARTARSLSISVSIVSRLTLPGASLIFAKTGGASSPSVPPSGSGVVLVGAGDQSHDPLDALHGQPGGDQGRQRLLGRPQRGPHDPVAPARRGRLDALRRQRTSSSTRTCSGLRSLCATCSARYAVSFSASATLHSRKPRCSRICARWYSTVRPVQS